jgi:RecB family exonuclease
MTSEASETRSERPWTQASASQVQAFWDCPRAWYNRAILGKKQPQTPAQERGTQIHAEVEHWLRTAAIRPGEHAARVEDAVRHIPCVDVLVEHGISLDTFPGGPRFVGFVDCLAETADGLPWVVDHKTTSDFRYAKTPEELRANVQMVAYAYWAMRETGTERCRITHVYIKTKVKNPQSMRVDAELTLDEAEAFWTGRVLPALREMQDWAAKRPAADELPPNTESCGKYGGCFYRPDCGFVPLQKITTHTNGGSAMNLMERLKASAAKTPPTGTTEAVVAAASMMQKPSEHASVVQSAPTAPTLKDRLIQKATGVLPPDAPPRTTSAADVAEEEAAKAPKPKAPKAPKAAPKKEISITVENSDGTANPELTKQVQEVAPSVPMPAGSPAATSGKLKARPVVYVGCYPRKGPRPVDLLEWLPRAQKAASDALGIADYRLDYAEKAKAALALAIREMLDDLPAAVFVPRGAPGAAVFMEVITPHASEIIEGTGF